MHPCQRSSLNKREPSQYHLDLIRFPAWISLEVGFSCPNTHSTPGQRRSSHRLQPFLHGTSVEWKKKIATWFKNPIAKPWQFFAIQVRGVQSHRTKSPHHLSQLWKESPAQAKNPPPIVFKAPRAGEDLARASGMRWDGTTKGKKHWMHFVYTVPQISSNTLAKMSVPQIAEKTLISSS